MKIAGLGMMIALGCMIFVCTANLGQGIEAAQKEIVDELASLVPKCKLRQQDEITIRGKCIAYDVELDKSLGYKLMPGDLMAPTVNPRAFQLIIFLITGHDEEIVTGKHGQDQTRKIVRIGVFRWPEKIPVRLVPLIYAGLGRRQTTRSVMPGENGAIHDWIRDLRRVDAATKQSDAAPVQGNAAPAEGNGTLSDEPPGSMFFSHPAPTALSRPGGQLCSCSTCCSCC